MKGVFVDNELRFKGQTAHYKGKVRDVHRIGSELLVVVVSDRISAFDHVLPVGIPYKGQVLNGVAAEFLRATEDIVPNWMLATPDPNVTVGERCEPLPVEMIVRGHLAGHAWREYEKGTRRLCGVELPDGLKKNDPLPEPVITPTTKAEDGAHDEDITPEELVERGVLSRARYEELASYSLQLFDRGKQMARDNGLILVDTKYEFGLKNGELRLIDEIHTPDSSRYFYADGFEERQREGKEQEQLSKEFVREWLMEQGFQGEGEIPEIPQDFVEEVSERYIGLYQRLTGKEFEPADTSDIPSRILRNVNAHLEKEGVLKGEQGES